MQDTDGLAGYEGHPLADIIRKQNAEIERLAGSADYTVPKGQGLDGTHYTPWQLLMLNDLEEKNKMIDHLEDENNRLNMDFAALATEADRLRTMQPTITGSSHSVESIRLIVAIEKYRKATVDIDIAEGLDLDSSKERARADEFRNQLFIMARA